MEMPVGVTFEERKVGRRTVGIELKDIIVCRYCRFSEDTEDYQDTYYCNHPTHNREYLVHSRGFCSEAEERQEE